MHEVLETIDIDAWDQIPSSNLKEKAIQALENGKILLLPKLHFSFEKTEAQLLSPHIVDPSSKNISYDLCSDRLGGTSCKGSEAYILKEMTKRYALQTSKLIENLFPHYAPFLKIGRTSYRPVETARRSVASYRQDDSLLHVDAFPSTPLKGKRILRVFTNVNPFNLPRIWKVGEPFADVVEKMAPRVSKPWPLAFFFLNLFKITKSKRSLYDHYMLQIHDHMKGDQDYQKAVWQKEIAFPACTWIVFSDQVSHAALAGQYLNEQSFYLPVNALQNPATSPLKILEKFANQSLI